MNLRFSYAKQEYMIPVMLILKALNASTDRDVYDHVCAGTVGSDTFVTDRLELLLHGFQKYELFTQKQCLEFIGKKFAVMLDSPDDSTQYQAGLDFLEKIVLVHLTSHDDKFNMVTI